MCNYYNNSYSKERNKIYEYFLSSQNILDILTAYEKINKIKKNYFEETPPIPINYIKYNDIVPPKEEIKIIDLSNLINLYNNFMNTVYETYNFVVSKYNELFDWNLKQVNYHMIHWDNPVVEYTSDIDILHKLLIDNVNNVYNSISILLDPINIKPFNKVITIQ